MHSTRTTIRHRWRWTGWCVCRGGIRPLSRLPVGRRRRRRRRQRRYWYRRCRLRQKRRQHRRKEGKLVLAVLVQEAAGSAGSPRAQDGLDRLGGHGRKPRLLLAVFSILYFDLYFDISAEIFCLFFEDGLDALLLLVQHYAGRTPSTDRHAGPPRGDAGEEPGLGRAKSSVSPVRPRRPAGARPVGPTIPRELRRSCF